MLGLDLALLLLAASQDGLLEQRLPLHRLARRRRAAAAARGRGRERLELAPQLRELRVLLAQLQLLRLRGATGLLPRLRLLLGGGLGLELGLGGQPEEQGSKHGAVTRTAPERKRTASRRGTNNKG